MSIEPPADDDRLLTVDEVAKLLGLCPKSVWLHTAPRGGLRSIHLGRSVRYSRAEVRRFIAELQSKSDAA